MLIGKICDDVNQKNYWTEAPDFETLIQALRNEVSEWGEMTNLTPLKLKYGKPCK